MKYIKNLLAATILSCTLAVSATATPILIPLDISKFPSYGDSNVGNQINLTITSYNTLFATALPTYGVGALPDYKADNSTFGTDKLSIDLALGGYNYIFLHWGGPDLDTYYKNPQLYYIGADTGTYKFVAPWNTEPPKDKQYGLSFYSFYSPINVPDNGSTVALLGLGLVGMSVVARKRL